MRVSLFPHSFESVPRVKEYTWQEFAANLGPHDHTFSPEAKKNKALPLFSPAEFRPGAKTKGEENVVQVHFGVLDLDEVNEAQLYDVCQILERHNAILYSTWSHSHELATSGLWRVRVVVEFTRPVAVNEWQGLWPRLVAYFGNVADTSCKDPSRCFYGPFAPPGTESDDVFVTFQGQPLDVNALKVLGPGALPVVLGNEKISRDRLERLAKQWLRKQDEWRQHMGQCLKSVVLGEAFAESGARDTTVFQLCQDLAKTFPRAEPMSIAAHFAQSLQVMGNDAPTVDQVRDKIARALEANVQEINERRAAHETETKLRLRQAFAHIDPTRDYPYTESELDEMATFLEIPREELSKRWVLQKGHGFYFLGPNGRYSPAYQEKEAANAALRDLAPASTAGVDLWGETASGERYRKPLATLVGEYGTVAQEYLLDLRATETRYREPTRTLTVAPCPPRNLVPTYDPEVAMWLQILCQEKVADVNRWLALVTDLDNPCVALLFTGAGDTGKSLFAHAVSRIWTVNGPTKLSSAMAGFNHTISTCPLVFGDEQLPKDFKGNGRTAELREFIAAFTRPYNRKFHDETTLLGCTRVVIAANNEDILAISENLSVNDINAIGDRFYHVKVNPDAIAYLQSIDAQSIVKRDRLAKHALWLRDNTNPKREGRFLIKNTDRALYRALTTKSGIRSAILQWLVGYLRDPKRVDVDQKLLVRILDGQLLVNPKGVVDNWTLYMQGDQVPQAGRLSSAINGLSCRRIGPLQASGGNKHNYYVIDKGHLLAWVGETEYATPEEINAALENDTPLPQTRPTLVARK